VSATPLSVAATHPAFAGHFPGAPVLPGVVMLDEALRAIELGQGGEPRCWRLASVKFLKAVRPGEPLALEQERLASGAIRFTILSAGQAVASGQAGAASEDT
jgi:3-hydroxyacyl-[acyl-carrier-protein] dehydratase